MQAVTYPKKPRASYSQKHDPSSVIVQPPFTRLVHDTPSGEEHEQAYAAVAKAVPATHSKRTFLPNDLKVAIVLISFRFFDCGRCKMRLEFNAQALSPA